MADNAGLPARPPDPGPMLVANFTTILAQVRGEQRMLVLVANSLFERMVNALIGAKCKNRRAILAKGRSYTYSVKLVILHEMRVLTDATFANLNWVRKLSERAVRDESFAVRGEDLGGLKAKYQDPAQLHRLLAKILAAFWDGHADVFVPAFLGREPGGMPGAMTG
jgi:hypothetical protein